MNRHWEWRQCGASRFDATARLSDPLNTALGARLYALAVGSFEIVPGSFCLVGPWRQPGRQRSSGHPCKPLHIPGQAGQGAHTHTLHFAGRTVS